MRLREANQRRCLPPIEESRLSRDLDGIVKSVMRYEAGHGTSREHRVDDDIFIALCRSGAMDKAGLGNAVRYVVALLLAWIKQKGGVLRSDYDGIRRMAGGHVSDKTIAAAVKFLHSIGLIPFPRMHDEVGNRATNFYRLTSDSRLFRACLADSRPRAPPQLLRESL